MEDRLPFPAGWDIVVEVAVVVDPSLGLPPAANRWLVRHRPLRQPRLLGGRRGHGERVVLIVDEDHGVVVGVWPPPMAAAAAGHLAAAAGRRRATSLSRGGRGGWGDSLLWGFLGRSGHSTPFPECKLHFNWGKLNQTQIFTGRISGGRSTCTSRFSALSDPDLLNAKEALCF